MNTDKQNFQKWLSSNGNMTHAIHVTPNKYSDTQMRKYFSWDITEVVVSVVERMRNKLTPNLVNTVLNSVW